MPRLPTPSIRPRTQAERSETTRNKILAVTLDLIEERGLRETSTVLVAERAGVSRGALLHHFPSKTGLLQEAQRTMLSQATDRIRAMAAAIDAGEMDVDGFLDALWREFSGSLFMVTLDYVTTARTDCQIMTALRPVAQEFNDALDAIWERFFVHSRLPPAERRLALNTTLCLLRGMGVQSVWRQNPALFDDMLTYWKQRVLTTILQPPDTGRPDQDVVPLRATIGP